VKSVLTPLNTNTGAPADFDPTLARAGLIVPVLEQDAAPGLCKCRPCMDYWYSNIYRRPEILEAPLPEHGRYWKPLRWMWS
jgi:hypothetical protein